MNQVLKALRKVLRNPKVLNLYVGLKTSRNFCSKTMFVKKFPWCFGKIFLQKSTFKMLTAKSMLYTHLEKIFVFQKHGIITYIGEHSKRLCKITMLAKNFLSSSLREHLSVSSAWVQETFLPLPLRISRHRRLKKGCSDITKSANKRKKLSPNLSQKQNGNILANKKTN